jgi:[ribosomal protein S5]-alanine N-acetyltransferase
MRRPVLLQAHMLTISLPSFEDVEALLAFELENRDYFEQWVRARPESYYSLSAVRDAIHAALDNINSDRAYEFLVRFNDQIVGRVNLVGVTRSCFNKATLGYRIGQRFSGNGYASKAVKLAIEVAERGLRLSRIEAMVRPENVGSIRVLERCGFSAFGRAKRSMYFHGAWSDQLCYERHLGESDNPPQSGPCDTLQSINLT